MKNEQEIIGMATNYTGRMNSAVANRAMGRHAVAGVIAGFAALSMHVGADAAITSPANRLASASEAGNAPVAAPAQQKSAQVASMRPQQNKWAGVPGVINGPEFK